MKLKKKLLLVAKFRCLVFEFIFTKFWEKNAKKKYQNRFFDQKKLLDTGSNTRRHSNQTTLFTN
jgi:hypothetical protein